MKPRTTAVLFAVALALGAFVYFYEIEGEEGRLQAEKREKQLFPDVETGSLEWIRLGTTDERDVRLERRGESWQVVEPLVFPADEFGVDSLASTLVEITSEAVYEEPQQASVYGLDDASREIRFGAGSQEYGLRTGDATPLGSNSYASVVGETPVYTVPTFRVNALRKSFDDLRDKRILDFDTASVQRLTASWPEGRVVLARGEEGWRLEAPVEGAADDATVRDLLSDLSFLRAASFADEPPPDADTGLDAPAFGVELELESMADAEGDGGSERRHLAFAVGAAEEDGQRHVRAGWPSLYLIRAERLDDFPRELAAYRFKELSRFGSLEAKKLVLVFHSSSGGATEAVTVTATRDGSQWSAEPENVDPDKLRRLVNELSRLEASNVLAEEVGPDELQGLELDPPNLTLRVYGEEPEDGEPELLAEVRVGALRGSEGIVAQRADRPEVFQLDPSLAEHIPVNLEALRNRFLAAPEAPPVEEAEPPGLEAPPLRFEEAP